MASTNTGGGTLSRLASLAIGAGKKAEDEEDKDKKAKGKKAEDEEEPDDKKAEEEEEEHDDTDEKTKKKSKAKAKDDEECAEDDDGDEYDKDKKGKKAKAEKDKDEDHDDSDEKGTKKKAAASERRRIRNILTSEEAALSRAHYANALYIATETDMDEKTAIGMLRCMPVSGGDVDPPQPRQQARERLSQTPNPEVGSDAGDDGKGPTLAQKIIAAGAKRRGETA